MSDMTIANKNTETNITTTTPTTDGRPQFDIDNAFRQAKAIAASGMFGLNKPEDVLTIMMTGHDLGFSPTASIRAVHIIKGRPFLSADAMVAVVLKSGNALYFQPREMTEKSCTYITHRKGSSEPVEYTFTIEDAKRAGLLNNDNWNKWPKDMLRARAASKLARLVYPDAVLGVYVTEEAADFATPINARTEVTRGVAADVDAMIMGEVVEADE